MSAPQLFVATRFLPPAATPVPTPSSLRGATRKVGDQGDAPTAIRLPPLPYAPAQQATMRQLQADVEDLWQSLQISTQINPGR